VGDSPKVNKNKFVVGYKADAMLGSLDCAYLKMTSMQLQPLRRMGNIVLRVNQIPMHLEVV